MELDSQFILQKEVNWSLLNHGLPIPVSVWNLFHAWDANILNHGASRQIKIMIGRDMFDAALINQNFNQQKFPSHKDIIQIRYSENSPIAKRLRTIFYKSYEYLAAQRQLEENNRKQISLPDNLREYIRMYFTSSPDVFCIECCTDDEYQQIASTLSRMPEEMFEASDDDRLFMEDKSASIIERERIECTAEPTLLCTFCSLSLVGCEIILIFAGETKKLLCLENKERKAVLGYTTSCCAVLTIKTFSRTEVTTGSS